MQDLPGGCTSWRCAGRSPLVSWLPHWEWSVEEGGIVDGWSCYIVTNDVTFKERCEAHTDRQKDIHAHTFMIHTKHTKD